MICGTGGSGEVDGDGLGVADADAVGDGEAVGDVDGTGDLDGDGCPDPDADGDGDADGDVDGETAGDVPGDVTVSTAGVISAGTTPGRTVGDEDDLGNSDRAAGCTGNAGLGVEDAPIAASCGWSCVVGGCLIAPARAKLMAAEAAMRLAATPATASGRHSRRRRLGSRRGGGTAAPGARPASAKGAAEPAGPEGREATRTGLGRQYSANAPIAMSARHPVAACTAATLVSSSSAVGRSLVFCCAPSRLRPRPPFLPVHQSGPPPRPGCGLPSNEPGEGYVGTMVRPTDLV